MATINLGAIKFNWKGAYNSSTSYAVDDVVSSGGNSYVCIQAHSNQAVGDATAYWNIMSAKGTNGTNGTNGATGAEGGTTTLTTQGDLLYRDGSGLARLGYGTAGQVLKTGGSGANPSWGTAPSGKILNVFYSPYVNTYTQGTNNTWYDFPSGMTQTITPQSVDSKFWITFRVSMGTDGNHTYTRIVGGGNPIHVAPAYSSAFQSTSSVSAKTTWDMDEMVGSYLWDANTSSSTTIKIQYAIEGTGYINRGQRDDGGWYDARAVSEMTIFELNN